MTESRAIDLPDVVLALRALEEGDLDRADLKRLFSILDSWQKADLRISCGELLSREFRIPPTKVRRWETELGGAPSRRIGKYQLRRRIGQGGMGIVFEAEHPNLDRPVALKILPPSAGNDPAAIQRFLTEVKSAGRFNHRNIVHAYDAGIDGDIPFLVMEYIDGENLFQVLQRSGPIGIDEAMSWMKQAAHALRVLEETGWIHGDVKPSNWIIATGGTLKLADLGLCRPPGTQRNVGTIFGSPPYIAPELLRGEDTVDNRSDFYSLGATFFHLLTGKPPYPARSVAELARAQKTQEIPPIQSLRPEVPDDLASVIDRLLASRPEDRLGSCSDVLAELGETQSWETPAVAIEDGVGVRATPSRPPEPERSGVSRATLFLAIGLATPLLLGSYFLASYLLPNDEEPAPETVSDSSVAIVTVEPGQEMRGPALEWATLVEREPRDYAALFRWLHENHADSPRSAAWEADLEARLSLEAEPLLDALRARVEDLRQRGEFAPALASLQEFPERLRVGSYEFALEQLRQRTERLRQERLGELTLPLEAAIAAHDWMEARRQFRMIAAEPPSERAWYRQQIVRGFEGLPWLQAHDRAVREQHELRARRRVQVAAAFERGEVPAPLGGGEHDLILEALLVALQGANNAVQPSPREWEGMFEHGMLTRIPEPLLLTYFALRNPDSNRSLAAECRAAVVWERVVAACRAWQLEPADSGWRELGEEPLRATLAGDRAERSRERDRQHLRRGVFLRGDAFVADVGLSWGGVPSFAYEFGEARVRREWRLDGDHWRQEQNGVRCKASERALKPLENIIPFAGSFRVELEFSAANTPWEAVFALGEWGIGVRRSQEGEASAARGNEDDLMENLRTGQAVWPLAGSHFAQSTIRFTVEFDSNEWRIFAGSLVQRFPVEPTDQPHWFAFHASDGLLVERIRIVGEPHPLWIEARAEALQELKEQ